MARSVGNLGSIVWKITKGQGHPPKGVCPCTRGSFFQKKYLVRIRKKFDNFTKMSKV